jgi:hypothetical protein
VKKVAENLRKPGIRKNEARLFCFDRGKDEVKKSNRISLKYKNIIEF